MKNIRKYLILLKGQVLILSEYRWDLIVTPIVRSVNFVIYFLLWRLTAGGDAEQERKLFLYYFLMMMILHPIHTGKTAELISRAISTGNLNQYLLKPINFVFTKIIESFAPVLSRIAFTIIILFGGIIFFPSVFAPYSLSSSFDVICFCVVSDIIYF